MHLTHLTRRAVISASAAAAAVREARALHPRGTTRAAVVTTRGSGRWGSLLLDEPAVRHGVVRFSRAAGLPPPLPDVDGMALRLPDVGVDGAPLDLLMNTAWRFLVAPTPLSRTRSSILTYRNRRGENLVLGARADGEGYRLLVARPFGRWQPWGHLTLGPPVPGDDLCFAPTVGADDLVPAAFLRDVRASAYAVSQAARLGTRMEAGSVATPDRARARIATTA